MSNKKFILNADDFGMTTEFNRAVLEGHQNGFLKSTSVCANGTAFKSAMEEIIPECPNLGIGVHLNIIEGKALVGGDTFNDGYLKLMALSSNASFLEKIEKEFRAQIELIMNYVKPTHIDSHVHVHAIPNIFKLTAKLAKEYGIPQIRTQHEEFYLVPSIKKHVSLKYPPNILKILLLNSFTSQNKNVVKEYGLNTNDFLLGVGYTGMMDSQTVFKGLEKLEMDNVVAEALIHPCKYNEQVKNHHSVEFGITQDRDLEDKIKRLGFDIVNYKG